MNTIEEKAGGAEIPSKETINKISDLIIEFTEQYVLRKNVSPIVQEFIDKKAELIDSDEGDKLEELYNYYEAKYVQENWNK